MSKNVPERVWLQTEGDSFGRWEGQTWCCDKINDSDTAYIRFTTILDKLKGLEDEWMSDKRDAHKLSGEAMTEEFAAMKYVESELLQGCINQIAALRKEIEG